MSASRPELPDQWETATFDTAGDPDIAFVRDDRAAYVIVCPSDFDDSGPDLVTECYQFVCDVDVGEGAYVRSHVALARSVRQGVSLATEFIRTFEAGDNHVLCFTSDCWREFREFFITDTQLPDDIDAELLGDVIDEDDPSAGVDGIDEDVSLEPFRPDDSEDPDLMIDVDVFPRHLDDLFAVTSGRTSYEQEPPTPDPDEFARRFPYLEDGDVQDMDDTVDQTDPTDTVEETDPADDGDDTGENE